MSTPPVSSPNHILSSLPYQSGSLGGSRQAGVEMRHGPDLLSLFGQIHLTLLGTHTYVHRLAHKIQLAICNTQSSLNLELVKEERGKMDVGLFHEHLLMKTNSLRNKARKKLFLSFLVSPTIIRVCLACLIYISGNGCNMKYISITYKVFFQYFYIKM